VTFIYSRYSDTGDKVSLLLNQLNWFPALKFTLAWAKLKNRATLLVFYETCKELWKSDFL